MMLVKEQASKRDDFQGRHLTLSHVCIIIMNSGLYMGMGFIRCNKTCNFVIVLYISPDLKCFYPSVVVSWSD